MERLQVECPNDNVVVVKFLMFETESCVSEAGLQLAMHPRPEPLCLVLWILELHAC